MTSEFVTFAGIVTILSWIASRLYELYRDQKRTEREEESFRRALFAEIDYNTCDMQNFLESPISFEALKSKFEEDRDYIPHVTDARHTLVYRSNIDMLYCLNDELIGRVVAFYGDLEKTATQIDGLQLDSYRKISAEGRVNVIRRLRRRCEVCLVTGEQTLASISKNYPELKLTRSEEMARTRVSSDGDDAASLHARLKRLSSHLERIGSKHKSSP